MPGIRPQNWRVAYESILTATNDSFELIIISPFDLPSDLNNINNIKYIKDFGSPTRASQIGCYLSEGKFLFPNFCDDAVFIPKSIDQNLQLLLEMGENNRNVISCKYSESDNFSNRHNYQSDEVYFLVNSYPVNRNITPSNWYILNNPFWHRDYFEQLGGYDCIFGVCPIAHADLAVRAYIDGANIKLSPIPIMEVDHGQDDHKPIEISQLGYDAPAFQRKYFNSLDAFPTKIPFNNWKNADNIWKFRFS